MLSTIRYSLVIRALLFLCINLCPDRVIVYFLFLWKFLYLLLLLVQQVRLSLQVVYYILLHLFHVCARFALHVLVHVLLVQTNEFLPVRELLRQFFRLVDKPRHPQTCDHRFRAVEVQGLSVVDLVRSDQPREQSMCSALQLLDGDGIMLYDFVPGAVDDTQSGLDDLGDVFPRDVQLSFRRKHNALIRLRFRYRPNEPHFRQSLT